MSDDNVVFSYITPWSHVHVRRRERLSDSVIAPSLLFEDVELERPQDELPEAAGGATPTTVFVPVIHGPDRTSGSPRDRLARSPGNCSVHVRALPSESHELFEQLVRGSAAPETVGYLFLLLLPPVLTFTIPVGVLVGTLIALSRMSADAEVTAMRANGLSSRRLLRPVLGFALAGTMITAAMSTWLTLFRSGKRTKS